MVGLLSNEGGRVNGGVRGKNAVANNCCLVLYSRPPIRKSVNVHSAMNSHGTALE